MGGFARRRSLGGVGAQRHAPSFFSGIDVVSVDYSPAQRLADPTAAIVPFQPSYEDRPGAPDRVFAAVDDEAYERLVAAWSEALARAGATSADVLHLHHLTPANEAALRAFPAVPVVVQLHGTEIALLRAIEAGAPAGWRFAGRWAARHLHDRVPVGRGEGSGKKRPLTFPGSERVLV